MSPANTYGEKIYEGKAKILYRAQNGHVVHYFKNSATAFNAQKKAEFEGKGKTNLRISSLLFQYLKDQGVSSHFVKVIDAESFETLALQMLPVEVVIRNILAGSLAKRLQEKEGRDLNPPVVEFYYKDDAKGDPLVSEDVLIALYGQKAEDLQNVRHRALEINRHLKSLFEKAGLRLVDFKLEFGKTAQGEILLADEISPDTCRLWDAQSGEKLDKDRFRFDLGDLMTGYAQVVSRLERVLQK